MRSHYLRLLFASAAAMLVTSAFAGSGPVAPSRKLQQDLRGVVSLRSSLSALAAGELRVRVAAFAKAHTLTLVGDRVLVEVFLADTSASAIASLSKFGITRDRWYGRINSRVQALVPLSALNALAEARRVNYVQPPSRPHADVISEGVAKTFANTYQAHSPVWDGTGVKVAIIDLGFQGYAAKLGTELPANVTAISFRADNDLTGGGEVHGVACAEVVHDMAPGAQLYLLNFNTVTELNNAVNYCITNGIKVISHSIGWTNMSFYDGTGDLKTIVDNATTAGIVWCNSAGNQQQRHWDGIWNDPNANNWQNFTATDEDININLTAGTVCSLSLTWDEWTAAKSDLDLFLYRDVGGNLVLVASSTNPQTGTQPPDEEIDYNPTQTGLYHIKIKRNTGTSAVRMALFCFQYNFAEYNVAARSLLDPSPVVNAYAVGAAYWSNDVIESFSSLGPTEDGRVKPDISAPDGNTNSVYGTFYGTSSACPHTAGAAALLFSQNATLTAAQVKTILTQNAMDLGAAGADNSYGAGRLRMPDVVPPSTPSVTSSTHSVNVWSIASTVTVSWPASTDSWSGVAGYSYVWDHLPNTVPDTLVDGTGLSNTSLRGDAGNWYFHIRAVDSALNGSGTAHFGPLKIDSTAPPVPQLIATLPATSAWSNRDTLKASWSDSDLTSGMKGYVALVDHAPATVVNSGLPFASASLATAIGEGTWYLHVAGIDSAGNWSPTLHTGPFRIDHKPPMIPQISTGAVAPRKWINQRHLSATWSSTDSLSGVWMFRYDWDTLAIPATFADSTVAGVGGSRTLADGKLWMLHVVAIDSAGNTSARADAGPFYVDSTMPTLPSTIAITPDSNVWSRRDTITVAFSGQSDAMSGIVGVAVSWDSVATALPTQVYRGVNSLVNGGMGDRRGYFVHMRSLDSAGNWSALFTGGPYLIDAHAPSSPTIVFSSMLDTGWVRGAVDTIHWSIPRSDTAGLNNLNGYAWSWTANASAVQDSTLRGRSDSCATPLAEGRWYFQVRAADSAGNWSGVAHYGPLQIDRTAPVGSMKINNGDTVTTSAAITIAITATDSLSGPARAILSDNGLSIGSMDFTGATLNFPENLAQSGGAGKHAITARVVDHAGNWSTVFGASIVYVPSAVRESVVPAADAILRVYPDPVGAGGDLVISASGPVAAGSRITLVDLLGRMVIEDVVRESAPTLTLGLPRSLAPGVYRCRVIDRSHTVSALVTVVR